MAILHFASLPCLRACHSALQELARDALRATFDRLVEKVAPMGKPKNIIGADCFIAFEPVTANVALRGDIGSFTHR